MCSSTLSTKYRSTLIEVEFSNLSTCITYHEPFVEDVVQNVFNQTKDYYPVCGKCDANADKKRQEEPHILCTATWHELTDSAVLGAITSLSLTDSFHKTYSKRHIMRRI